MFDVALAVPRRALGLADRLLTSVFEAIEAVPRIATAVDDLRGAIRHAERLATFAAEELPEIVYQLEAIRSQLNALERQLTGSPETTSSNDRATNGGATKGTPVSPESPRTG